MGIVNQQPMAMDLPAGAFRTDEKEVQTKIHRFFFQNIISNKFRHHLNVIQQSQGVRHLWFFFNYQTSGLSCRTSKSVWWWRSAIWYFNNQPHPTFIAARTGCNVDARELEHHFFKQDGIFFQRNG
jgi:hypothetical protein